MRLVLFESPDHAEPTPGLLTERGIVDISGVVAKSYTPQLTMQGIIDGFDRLRPALDRLARDGAARGTCSPTIRRSAASASSGCTSSPRRGTRS